MLLWHGCCFEVLTKDLVKDLVETWHISHGTTVQSNIFIEHPQLLMRRCKRDINNSLRWHFWMFFYWQFDIERNNSLNGDTFKCHPYPSIWGTECSVNTHVATSLQFRASTQISYVLWCRETLWCVSYSLLFKWPVWQAPRSLCRYLDEEGCAPTGFSSGRSSPLRDGWDPLFSSPLFCSQTGSGKHSGKEMWSQFSRSLVQVLVIHLPKGTSISSILVAPLQ